MPESVSVPSLAPAATTKWPAPSLVTDAAVMVAAIGRGVDAGAADERVVAAAAGEDVVAGVAGDDVGVAVAGAVDVAAAGEGQVLDVGAERVGDRRLHRVGALVGRFRDHVAGVVDDVGVVAGAAVIVSAPAPPSRVLLPLLPVSDVVERVAGAVDVAAAGQRQVLDIGAERVADRRLHRVGAFAERLGHHVAGVVDDVGVVAGAAAHRVGAGAAVERVVAAVAGDDVGVGRCRCR